MRGRHPRRTFPASGMLVLGFSGLLSALSYVTWRQSRAFEALAELDGVEHSISLAESERADLVRRIQSLDNRPRISAFAQEFLGMHHPRASEMRLLPGGPR